MRRNITVTDDDREALSSCLGMLVENLCGCNTGGLANGYLGHEKGCWVHIERQRLKRAYRLLGRIAAVTK